MKKKYIAILIVKRVILTSLLMLILSTCSNPFDLIQFPGEENPTSPLKPCYLKEGGEKVYYECNQIIVNSNGNGSSESYLREKGFTPIRVCDCNSNLQLWIPNSNQPIDASGIVKNAPPSGNGVGDLYLNFRINFSPINGENNDNTFDGNIIAAKKENLPIYSPLAVDCRRYEPVKVAVLDTGVDFYNEILRDFDWGQPALTKDCFPNPRIYPSSHITVYGVDILRPDYEPIDYHGHGTHVQGIISGVASPKFPKRRQYRQSRNDLGVRWKEPLEFIHGKYSRSSTSSGSLYDLICSGYYVIDQGAKVINISGGFMSTTQDLTKYPPFQAFLQYAYDNEVLIVASIGNDGKNLDGDIGFFPASYASIYPNLISVGAIDNNHHDTQNGQLAYFSNRAFDYKEMTITAWGTGVPSTASRREFTLCPDQSVDLCLHQSVEFQSGTSMAAPFITRTAAIMLSLNPDLSPEDVKDIIVETATESKGIRILNSESAIKQACARIVP